MLNCPVGGILNIIVLLKGLSLKAKYKWRKKLIERILRVSQNHWECRTKRLRFDAARMTT